MSSPSLPSLTVSALLVPLPFSSWVIRHSEMESAAQPSWMPNPTSDHRPYLNLPDYDTLSEPIPLPAETPDTHTDEFSFRAAWELTRSLESLPGPWRHTYRRWNRILSEDHDLSMSSGGAHRFVSPQPPTTPPRPPAPTTLEHAFSRARAVSRTGDMRARLYRRLGIVRCARTNRFARDPDSSWTAHGPLDRRVLWAHT